MNHVESRFYLDVWFKNNYKSKGSEFEKLLQQSEISYHSPDHSPNCYVLTLFYTFPSSATSSLVSSHRVKNVNNEKYQQFINKLGEILELSDSQLKHITAILSNPDFYPQ